MNPEDAPPSAPLARLLFGWTFSAVAVAIVLGALAALGLALVALEALSPRAGLRMPFEGALGYYASIGAGAAAGLLALAGVVHILLRRQADPYPEDGPDGDRA